MLHIIVNCVTSTLRHVNVNFVTSEPNASHLIPTTYANILECVTSMSSVSHQCQLRHVIVKCVKLIKKLNHFFLFLSMNPEIVFCLFVFLITGLEDCFKNESSTTHCCVKTPKIGSKAQDKTKTKNPQHKLLGVFTQQWVVDNHGASTVETNRDRDQ